MEAEAAVTSRVYQRLQSEGRWDEIEPHKNALIKEARREGMTRDDARRWAYGEIDRLYPPLPPPPEPEPEVVIVEGVAESANDEAESVGDASPLVKSADETKQPQPPDEPRSRAREDRLAEGLADLPPDWPTLPANAALAAEISWVQANRLRVARGVDEEATVDLSKALSPAPSWAALGWLETSIRAYAKYCDIAAKATASQEDEREHVRRERIAIDEVRSLLAEMIDTKPGT